MRKPAQVFSPGSMLREELFARKWTHRDLAERSGLSLLAVGDLIIGRREVCPCVAEKLEAGLGVSAEFWLNVETMYRDSLDIQPSGGASGEGE